ncbi:uncharacterized protein LOC129976637 [Argiope bruennichi]|uniref:uncharacterized protein LOC129976637 n=1 Tax=Argiope bruennichi TaxID=94029 RepID=UPI002494D974|nr:uncharacterized protein LOC129976637 [Argiope bruennichi]XP_055946289.1 uncharacterized protein LOC129976637 [Argiope bruennichi]
MLKMDKFAIRLVYFCSLSVSFLASHEHDHRPNRLDTDPDMDLMPMTRFWHSYTTPRPMTLRDPMILPGMPHEPKASEDYEYYNYEDELGVEVGMTSSGHVDYHLESTTHAQEEEYVYTDAGASNAKNEFFVNSAARLPSWRWAALFSTALSLLLL